MPFKIKNFSTEEEFVKLFETGQNNQIEIIENDGNCFLKGIIMQIVYHIVNGNYCIKSFSLNSHGYVYEINYIYNGYVGNISEKLKNSKTFETLYWEKYDPKSFDI